MTATNESLPDVPSKINQRKQADEDTDNVNDIVPPEERRARNVRNYHRTQIAELRKAIAAHQAVVDEQNVILGEEDVEDVEDIDTTTEPLPTGTDVAARFHNAFNALYTVDKLQDELREANLSTSGNKDELIDRLVGYFNDEEEDEEENTDSDSTDSTDNPSDQE